MTVLALTSVKHAPGVTVASVALAAAWRRGPSPIVVEADPAGGDIAARAGLPLHPGLVSLAASARHPESRPDVISHVQQLPSGGLAVVCPASPDQATAAVVSLGSRIPDAIRAAGLSGLIDCGRTSTASPAEVVIDRADMTLLVMTPTLDAIEHARARLENVGELAHRRLALLLVGDRPYPPSEIELALGLPSIGVLAVDPRGVALLHAGHGGAARRSPLVRSARTVLDRVDRFVREPDEVAMS